MSSWYVYLLRDATNSLYTGISTDVLRRFSEHCQGTAKAAKYTRARKQLSLVYSCELGSRSLASRVEYRIKRLPKKKKEKIVSLGYDSLNLLKNLGFKK